MFLRLKFRNAKLFRTNRKTKDKCFILSDYNKKKFDSVKRSEFKEYIEPITKYQISNMLHILLGERPVPKNRPVPYSTFSYIDEIANNSFIKINCIKRFNKTQNMFVTYAEGINEKRSLWNSWNPSSYPHTWRTIYLLLNNKKLNPGLYETVRNEMSKVVGYTITNEPFHVVLDDLRKHNLDELFNFLINNSLTKIKDYILNNTPVTAYGGRVSITNNKGLTSFESYSGELLIPVDSNLLKRFNFSNGSATLLDGGYVYIDGVLEDYEINIDYFDEFKKISEISTELK